MPYRTAAAWGFLLLSAAAGCGAAQAERQTPQWSVTFDNRALSDEQAQADLRASWARLADGSTLLASHAGSSVTLRGLGADGTTRFSRTISAPTAYQYTRIVLLAANAESTGAYVTASTTNPVSYTLLYRTDPSGTFDELLQLPDWAADGAGPAVALRTLPDDSVLVLRRRAITRIAGDGQLLWNFGNGEDGNHMLDATDFAVAPDGTVWVTARGGVRFLSSPAPFASVRRFLPNGQQLPQDLLRCTICTESRATGVTVLADGQAVVVGRSAPGEPGFVAFYSADGSRRLLVDTLPGEGYDRVMHDDAGNVYAFSGDTNTVSAIDIADGKVRWQYDGNDVAALASGVLISRRFRLRTGQLEVDFVDADGQLQWTRLLEASDGTAIGGAQRVDGGIALQLQIDRDETGCGKGPRIMTLDTAGNVSNTVAGCLTTRSLRVIGADAQPGVGLLASLFRRAVSLTPLGVQRWQFDTCLFCAPGNGVGGTTDAVDLLPNGASWLFKTFHAPDTPAARHEFVHLAPDGTVRSRTELPLLQGVSYHTRLTGNAAQAVALMPATGGGLHWIRASAGDGSIARQFIDVPGDYDTLMVTTAKPWPNGSLSLVIYTRNQLACQVSPGIFCRPPAYRVLRLNADGSERWRVDAGEGFMFVGFDEDGTTLIGNTHEYGPLMLRHIGANGVPGAWFVAAAGETMSLSGAAGPVDGRYLAVTDTAHVLIDASGNVLARRPYTTAWGGAHTNNSLYGFVTSGMHGDAALVSANDLSVQAEFDLDGVEGALWERPGNAFWSLFDDGSLYTSAHRGGDLNGATRGRVSRFAVPGSPAADIVFIGRFD